MNYYVRIFFNITLTCSQLLQLFRDGEECKEYVAMGEYGLEQLLRLFKLITAHCRLKWPASRLSVNAFWAAAAASSQSKWHIYGQQKWPNLR